MSKMTIEIRITVHVLEGDVLPGVSSTPLWSNGGFDYKQRVLTHEASGLRIVGPFPTKAAMFRMVPLLEKVDWERSQEDLAADPEAVRRGALAREAARYSDFRQGGFKEKFYAALGGDLAALGILADDKEGE